MLNLMKRNKDSHDSCVSVTIPKDMKNTTLAILATLIAVTFASCHKPSTTSHATPTSSEVTVTNQTDADKELAQRLREICDRAEGQIGFAVTHVETGRSIG